ncbi:putative transporter [Corchorus olitorius]|uniref:Transporter n=1 Tax=Corchorus olitorius TaxID=93759 RepID=A0A1R3KPI5_9ROSI|nr:putative transporter [Corchorus olitorius]
MTKDEVQFLGGIQMVQACDKAYGSALESLKKGLNLAKGNAKTQDVKASVDAANKAIGDCDMAYAESGRPSTFVPSNMNLKEEEDSSIKEAAWQREVSE